VADRARITVPLALPTLLAGALIAFLQALNCRLARHPGDPRGFHTLTTKIWSLFEFPPKPELAAAFALPLLVLNGGPCCAPSRWCLADVAMPCWAASTVRLASFASAGLRIRPPVLAMLVFVAAAVPALCGAVHTAFAVPAVRDAVDIFHSQNVFSRSGGLSSDVPALINTFELGP